MSLGQARETIETWRLDYNAVRPHSALGDVPPQEFEQLTLNRATAPKRLFRFLPSVCRSGTGVS